MDAMTLLPILLIGVVFYLLIMRPARARQKKQAEMMAQLQPGTEIMTTAGVYGTIVSMNDEDAEIAIAPGVVIRVVKAAIGRVIEPEDALPADDALPASEDAPRSDDGGPDRP